MTDYKKMYLRLFNAMTDIIRILQDAQLDVEEMYMSAEDTDSDENVTLMPL